MSRGNEPVIPQSSYITGQRRTWRGLTKREYFAAHALTGLLANPMNTRESPSLMADLAWQAADAALAHQEHESAGEERRGAVDVEVDDLIADGEPKI